VSGTAARAAQHFVVLPDLAAVGREAADRFVEAARTTIEAQGVFRVALSGGRTPNAVFPVLRSEPRVSRVDWSRVEFFWGDERTVPPDDPESNFGAAYRRLISRLPNVRPEAIHRMQAEIPDLEAAALAYEAELRLAFGAHGSDPPSFDLIWLGLGPDGHTASLFPGSHALHVTDRWVMPNWAPAREMWRMTFTLPLIDAAHEVLFLATGANKANAIRHIRRGRSPLPAARVRARRVVWLIDAAAAGDVSSDSDSGEAPDA
jgi:6-phosphogluconolactonase